MTERHPNRLAQESSPYLLGHANSPIYWFPWGQEALRLAQEKDLPLFVSIGYSASYLCHLMERESFADKAVAATVNEHFIPIQVDREERPDIDAIYMNASWALTGSGGWPMTVLALPNGEPFFVGTYFPPRSEEGRPGLLELVRKVVELWKDDKKQLLEQAEALAHAVRSAARPRASGGISAETIRVAARQLQKVHDSSFGGFGKPPKFPNKSALSLLLRYHLSAGDQKVLEIVERSLEGMMNGGIYDHLAGGFFCSSTDQRWLVPHFEKTSIDQAQLAELYLEAFQITKNPSYRRIARETFEFLLDEMQSPGGGFFSARGAESEGHEGHGYLWTPRAVRALVDEPSATHFCAFYGITEEGHLAAGSVPHTFTPLREVAKQFGLAETELSQSIELAKHQLKQARADRSAPHIDDKVIVSTNGLVIRSLCHGAQVLGEPRYLQAALGAADFVLGHLRTKDGRLLRSFRGIPSAVNAFVEDYVFLIDGLVSLHELTGGAEYLDAAMSFAEVVLSDFSDQETGALFQTPHQSEEPIARLCQARDGSLPAPNAVACRALHRLATHTARPELAERATRIACAFATEVQATPRAYTELLTAVQGLLRPSLAVVISGDPSSENYEQLTTVATSRFLPFLTCTRVPLGETPSQASALTCGEPPPQGTAIACLHENLIVKPSTSDQQMLEKQLAESLETQARERRQELGRQRLPGKATRKATKDFLDKRGIGKNARSRLGELSVSALALGSHRIGLDSAEHRQAALAALGEGINLIDTSPSFALGNSERLLGEVLASLHQQGADRSCFVLASKVGVALGGAAEQLQQLGALDSPAVALTPGSPLESGAYCLDPQFISWQIGTSLERLGVEHLDVVLLQSPEHLLLGGKGPEEVRLEVRRAILELEKEVSSGRIGCYGVFTTRQEAIANDVLSPKHLAHLAHEAAGEDHHFRVVEIPLNLLERRALEPQGDDSCLAAQLQALGLSVWAARPLSAVSSSALVRLVDPPKAPEEQSPPPLSTARYRVASLEAEFETTLAARLRLAGLAGQGPLLPLSGDLGRSLEKVESLQQFDLAETTMITPRLRQLLAELDRAFGEDAGQDWARFRGRYVEAVGNYLAAVRAEAIDHNYSLLQRLRQEVPTSAAFGQLPGAQVEPAHFAHWALGLLMEHPAVDITVVGLRSAKQASEALRLLQAARE